MIWKNRDGVVELVRFVTEKIPLTSNTFVASRAQDVTGSAIFVEPSK